ncbi:MAG TPA: hypothetical protein VF293_00255 [Candidatus Limnocylindrales bacterium]
MVVVVVAAAGLLMGQRGHDTATTPDPTGTPGEAATWPPGLHPGEGQWTGLEWHDITASAGGIFVDRAPWLEGSRMDEAVAWRDGFALVGGDGNLWISKDGLTWAHASGAPQYAGIVGLNGSLLAGGEGIDGSGPGLWISGDAVTWRRVPIPSNFYSVGCERVACAGLAASSRGVVAVATAGSEPNSSTEPSILYFSADGTTWNRANLPDQAWEVAVHSFFGGFAAIGMVRSPTDPPGALHQRAWRSPDGLNWTAYEPKLPGPYSGDLWRGWHDLQPWDMQFGPLGADNGDFHSSDGVDWAFDSEPRGWWYQGQAVSDGNRVVFAAKWVARFYLGEGDGHWRELAQGGDIGKLPGGGHAFLLPNGLLWVGGDRVYFGQALSGVAPRGSLALPTPTPSPLPGPS